MKFLVTLPEGEIRDTFFTKKQIAELEALGEIVWNPKSVHMEDDELKAALKDVDVVFTGWGTHKLTGEILSLIHISNCTGRSGALPILLRVCGKG